MREIQALNAARGVIEQSRVAEFCVMSAAFVGPVA